MEGGLHVGLAVHWLSSQHQFNNGRKTLDEREYLNQEALMLDLLARGLSREFPNPQRIGCPPSNVLTDIAFHQLRLAEVSQWLDHLSCCSPCYQEFIALRTQAARLRHRRQILVAVAAVLVFAVAGWLWVRTHQQVRAPETANLDLRSLSFTRGENSTQVTQVPLELHRSVKHLVLDLPIGSGEGPYDVALLDQAGTLLLNRTGIAQLQNQSVVLRADIDVGVVQPGRYFLALRRPDLEWTRYPVRVL